MASVQINRSAGTGLPDQSWSELYLTGAIACFVSAILIFTAVVAYFIWPYTPGVTSAEQIYSTLHDNLIGGLISLDILMVGVVLVSTLVMLALYVTLKPVSRSYALIALVLALFAIVLCLQARPIAEMVYLSNQYAAATTDLARSQYLSAGEALLAHFNGTTWILYTLLTGVSGLIYSLLMLRSRIFRKSTAYTGIILTIAGVGIFIPVIGIPLALLATICSVLWYVMIGQELLRAARPGQIPPLSRGS